MKVLICDDEYHVIQAIRLLVPWQQLGINHIFTASSVTESMEIIRREAPQLVITDIVMDDQNGMDLMSFIASDYPSIKVIAVSGHNDFEYVRTMLTKGCTDYLLKPLEADTLIQVVKKAVDNWKAEQESCKQRQNLKDQVQSLSNLYSGILLLKMMDEPDDRTACEELIQVNPGFSEIHNCRAAFYHIGYLPVKQPEALELLEQFQTRLMEYFDRSGNGIVLSRPGISGEIFLFLYKDQDSAVAFLQKTTHALFSSCRYPFHMGISREYGFPDQIAQACQAARDAFFFCETQALGPMMICETAVSRPDQENTSSDRPHPHGLEKKGRSALLVGDRQEIRRFTRDWLSDALPDKTVRLSHIRQAILDFRELYEEYVSMFRRQNPDFTHDPDSCLFSYENFLDEDLTFSRDLMNQAMNADLLLLCDEARQSSSNTDRMHQIAQYMELNYARPFVQADYARLFFINKDYMCRKFKDTFGVSMLTYLNQIRIEHAKVMLADPNLKIRDIAYAVGFEDEKYFARQFKKLTHKTPGDYRAGG